MIYTQEIVAELATRSASLFKNIVREHKNIFSAGDAQLIKALLSFLATHGLCPSVHKPFVDPLSTLPLDILARVSVWEHSLGVAERIVVLMKQRYRGLPCLQMPAAIVSSLGHDLGKIPEFGDQRDQPRRGFHGHAVLSVNIVREIAREKQLAVVDTALSAIRDHHTTSTDWLTLILKEADQAARRDELARYSKC